MYVCMHVCMHVTGVRNARLINGVVYFKEHINYGVSVRLIQLLHQYTHIVLRG